MEKEIKFLDLKAPYAELKNQYDNAYKRVMESGWFILGEEVQKFEQEFAQYCGADHCIGIGNGLEALMLILKAYDISEGDEVIVPSNTFIATWLAISFAGAKPVSVEPDIKTYNLDPALVEAAITSKTRAIIVVDLYGQMGDFDPILEIANRHNLIVIEDAAQSQGATYKGRSSGNVANAAGFSFYPGKNLGALGDAGAVVTNDSYIAERVKSLRNYGSKVKYHHDEIGYNFRLDELQAAFLREKLSFLDEWNQRRKVIAAVYSEGLGNIPELVTPFVPEWASPVWHIYAIHCKKRDELSAYLKENHIQTLIHYPIPPHLSEAYADMGIKKGAFPIAEELSETELSIPMGPHLSVEDAEYVVQKISDFFAG